MTYDYRDRLRTQREEWDRMEARERYANFKEREQQDLINQQLKTIDKQMRNEQFVARHGEDGAFKIILRRWLVGGAVFAIFGFIANLHDDGFVRALTSVAELFVVAVGIGYWRAKKVVNSVQ